MCPPKVPYSQGMVTLASQNDLLGVSPQREINTTDTRDSISEVHVTHDTKRYSHLPDKEWSVFSDSGGSSNVRYLH